MEMTRIPVNGIELGVTVEGHGPPVVLCHGWPELAYSWSNQIPAVTAAGFTAIAPDLRGFGSSDAPDSGYSADDIATDLAGLLDALGHQSAVFVGHDWGGAFVWRMAQRYPLRVRGVASLNTPHYPRSPAPPIAIQRKRHGTDHYWVYFQDEGPAEDLFAGDVERFFRVMFRKPAPREVTEAFISAGRPVNLAAAFAAGPGQGDLVMSNADLQVYVDAYSRTGFRGGLNLYRNLDRNWEQAERLDPIIRHPSLMISAELDVMLPPGHTEWMRATLPDLEYHVLGGVGHWSQWEAPGEVNEILVEWLARRFPV